MKNLIRLFDFISAAAVPYGIVLTPAFIPSIKISKPKWSNPLFFGIAVIGLFLSSCGTPSKAKKGAVIGTTSGAVIGAVIGKASGNVALGTVIGAAVGGTAGAVIGNKMDKQAAEIKKEVPGVKVERVGEGIVIEFSEKILFDYNKSDLKDDSRKSLDRFAMILDKYPDTNIEIQGHTDSKGSAEYNQALSERRAQSANNYLTSKNISGSRITTRGMGKNYPKVDNETEQNRADNRRVEFLISANEKMKADAKVEATKSN